MNYNLTNLVIFPDIPLFIYHFEFFKISNIFVKIELLKMKPEEFKKTLKAKGLKATPQRMAVHEAMLQLGHASADMVAEIMSKDSDTKVTIASVYNILSTFADLKIYSRRLSSNKKMYFDVNTFKHVHLYDSVNNEYKDIIDESLIEAIESHFRKRRFRGYKLDAIDIQLVCHPSKPRRAV